MGKSQDQPQGGSEIILYQSEDGRSRIEVRMEGGTVWLSQRLIADLYQVGVGTINHHIKGIYEDQELSPGATIRSYRIVQNEGGRRVESVIRKFRITATEPGPVEKDFEKALKKLKQLEGKKSKEEKQK